MPPTDPRSSTSPATGKPIAPRAAALVCALALAVLVQIGAGSPAALAAPPRAPTSLSITAVAADPAPRLQTHIQAYLNSRPSTASVMVRNLRNGRQYVYRPTAHYDSASIVKVAILAAVLRRQEQQHRYLTSTENRLLHRMIQYSD